MARNGFRVLDSDMHIMEPPDLWERYIESEFRNQAPHGLISDNVRDLRLARPDGKQWDHRKSNASRVPNHGHNFERNQKIYRYYAEQGWSAQVQLEAMDLEGIDVAVLYPTRGLTVLALPHMEPKLASAIARAYNNWLYDFCKADPNRLLGAGMISPFDIKEAVSETHRCAKELGFRGIFIRSNVLNDKNWHDDYYEPLWTALEELDMPLGFHEASRSGVSQPGERFEPNFMLRRVFAQPMEQMLALGSLCAGGVLARHPKLRVAFLEGNCSWLPWLLWRLDEGWELEGDIWAKDLTMPPSEYFKRQGFVSVEPDEATVRYVINHMGGNHLVFSTDYPHGDSKFPKALETFLKLPINDEDKGKILWNNCASYYAIC